MLLDLLVCPSCNGKLYWHIERKKESQIIEGSSSCKNCKAVYPIRDAIGIFLTPDLPREDLWAQINNNFTQYIQKHPDIRQKLLRSTLDELNPADQFFRGMLLENIEAFDEAEKIFKHLNPKLYTSEYLKCYESQLNHTIDIIKGLDDTKSPIVDIASGRCYLIEKLIEKINLNTVATDFSLQILRRNREWLKFKGLEEKVSLLALDARKTPFRNKSIKILTTNLGIPNIEQPGDLLKELRRITAGTFLAITQFYREDDLKNINALEKYNLTKVLIRSSLINQFTLNGWDVELVNECSGKAKQTPKSEILNGAGIDRFPVEETIIDWGILVAR